MIIPGSLYQHNASEQTITLLPPWDTITAEQIIQIRDLTTDKIIYNCTNTNSGHPTVSMNGAVITYTYNLSTLANGDKLQIFFEDQKSSVVVDDSTPLDVNVVNTGSLSPTAAPLITSSLGFAAGDVLTTEKLTAALTMSSLSSSGNYVISVTKPAEDTAGDLTLKLYNQVKTDGTNSTDQLVTTLTVEKVTGIATNRSFIVSGLGIGNGTIKIGGFFAADSGAITVNFTIHAIHTEDISIPTSALASGSLSFAIGEGVTEKLTTAIPITSLSPSGNYVISVTKPLEDTAGDLTLKLYNQVKTDGINSTDQLVTTFTLEKITGAATNRGYMLYGIGIGEGTIKIGGLFAANCAAATAVNFVINAM